MTASDALSGVTRLLLDTNPVIYILERDPAFKDQTWKVLHEAAVQGIQLVISPLTLIEVLSKPEMSEDELQLYAEFCLSTNEIEFQPLNCDDTFAVRIGFFRRTTGVKTPDCIQFASSERLRCDAILTNDIQYRNHAPCKAIIVSEIET